MKTKLKQQGRSQICVVMGPMPISNHKTKADAEAAKRRYEAADARRKEIT